MTNLILVSVLLFVVAATALWAERGKTGGENVFFVVVVAVLSAIGGLVVNAAG
ncbi:MAG: hypothetical protein H6525_06155 [Actinobacteria bacterium]|nr:hypothetical protein [Actinomycetota bacterium]MCB9412413.1 hypothetical protein [Actinomycetota bacterium]